MGEHNLIQTFDVAMDGILVVACFSSMRMDLLNEFALATLQICECSCWNKSCRFTGVLDFQEEFVNLFQPKTSGFVDEKVREREADTARATPYEEDLSAETRVARTRVDKIRGGVSQGPVEQPISCHRLSEALGSDLEGEELAGDHPSSNAPCRGEEEDEQADKGHEGLLSGRARVDGTDDGDDELTETHTSGSDEQQLTAPELLDSPEPGKRRDRVDAAGYHTDDEGILNARVLEERCTVVEDEVNPRQLLKSLKSAADE